jgi:O-antigen biosynthesis protein
MDRSSLKIRRGVAEAAAAGSLLAPTAPEIQHLDLDQFERYSVATRWVDRLVGSVRNRPVRLLEVGPNVLNLLPEFFVQDRIEVVRCDLFVPNADEPGFVKIEPNEPLPFEDHEFDGVLGLEVLEHVPDNERTLFLTECVRVARHGVVLTCPDGCEAVRRAERLAMDAYERRHGNEHPFLAEHAAFGQPVAERIRPILESTGARLHDHAISPLNRWLTTLLLQENLIERGVSDEMRTHVQSYILERLKPACDARYRRVYVVAKSVEAMSALDRMGLEHSDDDGCPVQPGERTRRGLVTTSREEIASTCGWMTGPELQRFVSTLASLHAELRDACRRLMSDGGTSPLVSIQSDLGTAADCARSLEQYIRTLMVIGQLPCRPDGDLPPLKRYRARLGASLRGARSRAARGAGRARRLLAPVSTSSADLLPAQGLQLQDAASGTWRLTGEQGAWIVPIRVAPGVCRFRLKIRFGANASLRVRPDLGGQWSNAPAINLGEAGRVCEIDKYIAIPHHAAALLLEVEGAPGEIVVERCDIEQSPRWMNAGLSVARKAWAAWQRGDLLNFARRGAGMILRRDFGRLGGQLQAGLTAPASAAAPVDAKTLYARYVAHTRLTDADRARLRDAPGGWATRPRFSLLMSLANGADASGLERTLASLRSQLYPEWECLISVPFESAGELFALLKGEMERDHRIRVIPARVDSRVSAGLNDTLERATGDFAAIVHMGDRLAEQALAALGERLQSRPEADVLYTDEDIGVSEEARREPFFKPDFSPEYLAALDYTLELTATRRDLLAALGGYATDFDGVHEYEALLRVSRATSRVEHIAEVLYHRGAEYPHGTKELDTPKLRALARRAVETHTSAQGYGARVSTDPISGGQRVRHHIAGQPKVGIVIPSACGKAEIRGRSDYLVLACVESIVRLSTWANYEIIVVDNNDMPADLEAALARFPQVKRVPFTKPFNLATKMTFGAEHSDADHFVFMNDDIEVISPDWMEALLEYSQQSAIGAVGARLLFPDDRLQHTGVTILGGNPGHHFYRFPKEHPGYFFNNVCPRNFTAVTGACAMVRADVFRQVGGFSDEFPLNYNDVDLCLKIRALGLRVVYTPHAELYHHESVTKSGTYAHELERFRTKWDAALRCDPYYNVNLSMHDNDYSIRRCPAA